MIASKKRQGYTFPFRCAADLKTHDAFIVGEKRNFSRMRDEACGNALELLALRLSPPRTTFAAFVALMILSPYSKLYLDCATEIVALSAHGDCNMKSLKAKTSNILDQKSCKKSL